MIRLLKIELKKILSYKTFWVLTGLFVFSLSFVLTVSQIIINKIVSTASLQSPIPLPKVSLFIFPKIWNNLTYIGGYFNIFLAIIVISLIANEFSYKTLRQNIIHGMSRKEFLLSKLYLITLISLATTVLLFLVGLILGLIHSKSPDLSDIFNTKLHFFIGYFIEVFTYLIFAFFISFSVKKASMAIIILLFYTMMEQIIVWWKVSSDFVMFMPMKAFGRLVHFPKIPLPEIDGSGIKFQDYVSITDSGIAVVYAAILIVLIYVILKKRDL